MVIGNLGELEELTVNVTYVRIELEIFIMKE